MLVYCYWEFKIFPPSNSSCFISCLFILTFWFASGTCSPRATAAWPGPCTVSLEAGEQGARHPRGGRLCPTLPACRLVSPGTMAPQRFSVGLFLLGQGSQGSFVEVKDAGFSGNKF